MPTPEHMDRPARVDSIRHGLIPDRSGYHMFLELNGSLQGEAYFLRGTDISFVGAERFRSNVELAEHLLASPEGFRLRATHYGTDVREAERNDLGLILEAAMIDQHEAFTAMKKHVNRYADIREVEQRYGSLVGLGYAVCRTLLG